MEKYENFLAEFDKRNEELQEHIEDGNYLEAANVRGYLLGMLRAVQIFSDSETDINFMEEVRNRVIFLAELIL